LRRSRGRNERFSAERALTLVSIVPPPQPLHTDCTTMLSAHPRTIKKRNTAPLYAMALTRSSGSPEQTHSSPAGSPHMDSQRSQPRGTRELAPTLTSCFQGVAHPDTVTPMSQGPRAVAAGDTVRAWQEKSKPASPAPNADHPTPYSPMAMLNPNNLFAWSALKLDFKTDRQP
jgi:hypothetical protein